MMTGRNKMELNIGLEGGAEVLTWGRGSEVRDRNSLGWSRPSRRDLLSQVGDPGCRLPPSSLCS